MCRARLEALQCSLLWTCVITIHLYSYHNVTCAALDFVCDAPVAAGENPVPTDSRLAFFNERRHSYGRTALLLSGGAGLGIYHIGVVKALIRNRLMPRVLSGASAGSIVCAMIGTRTDEECIRDMFEYKGTNAPGHSGRIVLNFIEPLHMPLVAHTKSRKRGILSVLLDLLTLKVSPLELLRCDSEHFRLCLRVNVGEFTFQEAFDRTGRILNITGKFIALPADDESEMRPVTHTKVVRLRPPFHFTVTPNNLSDPPRLLNYLTAPHVLIWSAAVASCSIPGVWEPQRLVVKDADGSIRYECSEGARFSDGSMEQDLPMQQLSEMFNVNHFIVSQANPHAVMFASFSHVRQSSWPGLATSVLTFLKLQCRSWLQQFIQLVGGQRYAPQRAISRGLYTRFFIQQYEGRESDISLIPWINHCSLMRTLLYVLYNPSKKDFLAWTEAAERETWKFLPAIKSHVAEEITLDRCVQRLRKRVLAESLDVPKHQARGRIPRDLDQSTVVAVQQCHERGRWDSDDGDWSNLRKTIPEVHQQFPGLTTCPD